MARWDFVTDQTYSRFFSFSIQLIQQVLAMTEAQIAGLDENSRNTILQIVSIYIAHLAAFPRLLIVPPAFPFFVACTSAQGDGTLMGCFQE